MNKVEITPELLADLKAKAEKATPGIWTILDECHCLCTKPTDKCPPKPVAWVSHGPGIPPEQSENNEDYLMAVSPDVVLALIERIEALEFDKKIFLKMTGKDVIFRCKIVKTMLAMARHLNLLPDARQSGFFYEDASLDDISDFAEKCLQRLKEVHNRDTLIENLGKEKVQWQETAERLDTAVNTLKKAFEDIRIWMEGLCLALGISLEELKGKTTNKAITCAIKRLIHDRAQLEKEANLLSLVLANHCCGLPLSEYIDMEINGMSPPAPEHWREAARRATETQCDLSHAHEQQDSLYQKNRQK